MVKRWSSDGQEMVKGVGQKASPYSNVFSAALTFRASPIALAPWSPIRFAWRLRPQESERMVRRWSRYGKGVVKGVA